MYLMHKTLISSAHYTKILDQAFKVFHNTFLLINNLEPTQCNNELHAHEYMGKATSDHLVGHLYRIRIMWS